MKIKKNGHTINSVDDWFHFAPPKRPDLHWKDGRSAKELAKAWFPADGLPVIPAELSSLLESSVVIGKIDLCDGEPEAVVHVDSFRGEPPNCDLLIHGTCKRGKVAIYVEAKADERFGQEVGQAFDNGERTNAAFAKGERARLSNSPDRIRLLTSAVLGTCAEDCRELRYQLLYGTAAALSATKHDALAAIFVVHEFVTECTEDTRHKQNAADLDKFVSTLSPRQNRQVHSRRLLGPFRVPGNQDIPRSVDLFIGKATRNTRLS